MIVAVWSLLALVLGSKGEDVGQNGTCSLWRRFNSSSQACECGDKLQDIVQCDSSSLALKNCYCMTYSQQLQKLYVGHCLYTCNIDLHQEFWRLDHQMSVSHLSRAVCELYNRTGFMCGHCIDDHAPAAYSYTPACVQCQHSLLRNLIKYIAVAYIPLTIFFLVIVIFRIPVASGAMMTYVALSQMCASPGLIMFYSARFERSSIKIVNGILFFYTIWNLDFFRSLYEPFCLHPRVMTLHLLCLDYLIGIYPLLLTVLTYFLVQLYDYKLVAWVCVPIRTCVYRFKKEWRIKESLAKAFATSLLLSYVKLMNVSVELLTPSHRYYDNTGQYLEKLFLHVNGSMEYFGEEHLPYAILAIVMMILFNLFPFLLICVYPCKCCQKVLNRFPCGCQALHTFMDTLQGGFKEQCRCFAGLYLALRMLNLAFFAYFKNFLYYLWATCLLVFFIVLLAVARPHKQQFYNALDPCLFFLAVIMYVGASIRFESLYVAPKEASHMGKFVTVLVSFSVMMFPLYGILLFLYRLFPFMKAKACIKWVRKQFCRQKEIEQSFLSDRRESTHLLQY